MPTQLSLRDVTVSYDGRLILDRISLTVTPGERVGVVGDNGAGKSTLLRLMAGEQQPDSGSVTVDADNGVGHLGQVVALPGEHTVGEAIDTALADLRAMERRMRELETVLDQARPADLAAYGDLLSAFEARGGYEADARVAAALDILGLAGIGHDRPLSTLSGGQRVRLALAGLLAAPPEILLLDEPTDHLDADATAWLEERVRAHRGTVVAVSHDRLFLERTATAILEVDAQRRTVVRHGDGYAGFLQGKAAARRRWEQDYERWCGDVERLTAQVALTARQVAPGRAIRDNNKMAYDRAAGRVQGSMSARIRNARERLRRLHADPVPRPPDPLRFTARPGGGETRGVLVGMADVAVGDRLAVAHLEIEAGQRLLVRGPNGAGKTTLLRVIAGQVRPDRGVVRRRGRIGLLPQHTVVTDPGRTLLDAFAAGRPGTLEEHAERLLSFGLFRPDRLEARLGTLSTGQLRRLSLARVLAADTDLLLLDEPTDHLSLDLVEELEEALRHYPGAIVVVSHDRALCRAFAGAELWVEEGRVVAPPRSRSREEVPAGRRG
ncbi:ribosomal protection-like ABC-F family protein [Marinactinospora thermotolerans]|uniref:Macrolide transport system ATP-binding/permease protein n=1 Tax=Marinactinospora thermotolerans DSM 45154 TaxID=1122192 RepID=A0A1T4QGJ7_9ACTN|nr:ABC-F family ATP-binding cassette domain-containing protein [Marinactinospora thermotolerans]SKA02839.1 macrolide transport system ATP-binding/permease protein [Marinactinospora thermotolerans DSM 45154]